jgi:hypothetical protein
VAEFDILRDGLDDMAADVLDKKGADYAWKGDKLSNFREIATLLGVHPLLVWAVYFMKPVIPLLKLAVNGQTESEPVEERFVDARNYVDLGYALFKHLGSSAAPEKRYRITPHGGEVFDGVSWRLCGPGEWPGGFIGDRASPQEKGS